MVARECKVVVTVWNLKVQIVADWGLGWDLGDDLIRVD